MKRIVVSALMLAILAISLTGCLISGPLGDVKTEPGTIFTTGSKLYVTVELGVDAFDENEVWNTLRTSCDINATLKGDDGKTFDNEIVIGNTNHPVSKAALKYLNDHITDDDTAAFLVYVDGCTLAVVYNNPLAAPYAIDYFYELIEGKTTLTLGANYRYTYKFSISEYNADLFDSRWDALNGLVSDEAILAARDLYSMFGPEIYEWIANLYDPEIGGFYYSNSARDNYGFLPDLESTRQALAFLKESGLCTSLADYIPKDIRDDIVAFTKGMQDPGDGYFYHPQWGKDIIHSRRGRDLSWAKYILNAFGASANYRLPDSADIEEMSYMTDRLGGSTVVAVSRVTATAAITDNFHDEASLLAYLDTLDFGNNSHSDFQQLSSQASVIKALGLSQVALDYVNARQNPENGLWEDDISFRSVGGLLKISSAYSTLDGKFNYAEQAIESCFWLASQPTTDTSMTGFYNCVNSISNLMGNMKRHGDGDKIPAIVNRMRSNAQELFLASIENLEHFIREDGAYSYNSGGFGSGLSQGALVSIAGVVESDMNATSLALGNILGLFSIMQLPSTAVYSPEQAEEFIYLLETAPKVVKPDPEPPEPETFDDRDLGDDLPISVSSSLSSKGTGSLGIVENLSVPGGGNALELTSKPGAGDGVYFGQTTTTSQTPTCFVFETDICFSRTLDGSFFQIFMLNSKKTATGTVYRLGFTADGNTITISDASADSPEGFTNSFDGVSMEVGRWHNLRIEYYLGDEDTVRIKTYIDGECVKISKNYGGATVEYGIDQPAPSSTYLYAYAYAMGGSDTAILFDNVLNDKIEKEFDDSDYDGEITAGTKDIFFDNYGSPNLTTEMDGTLDFEDFTDEKGLGNWSKKSDYAVSVYSGGGNGFGVKTDDNGTYLYLNKTNQPTANAAILTVKAAKESGANCHVFEATVRWSYSNLGSGLQIGLADGTGYNMSDPDNGKHYDVAEVGIYSSYIIAGPSCRSNQPTSTTINAADILAAVGNNKEFTIRIEAYTDADVVLLYINDALVCINTDVREEIDFSHVNLYFTKGFVGRVAIDDVTCKSIVKAYEGFDESDLEIPEVRSFTFEE